MTLLHAIELYLRAKRSRGLIYTSAARMLRSFGRHVGDLPLGQISTEDCLVYCRGRRGPSRYVAERHGSLRLFFQFLVDRAKLRASPIRESISIRCDFRPYIYSHEDLRRLLAATATLADQRAPLQALTFRTMFLLLYGAGLRAGEALRLKCSDVDLDEHVLTIRQTKFFKSRFVPIGPDLARALAEYRQQREWLLLPEAGESAFFATRTGHAVSLQRLEKVFRRLRGQAGIRRTDGARYQPRIHDLRHTFAVHRLISWYREGVDVQARLLALATYMGHVDIAGTQTYLTMTPELLDEASQRFEKYASRRRR